MLIWGLFHIENNIHLFKLAIGQQICALLDGFNILFHGVYQKFDENCIKTIKLGIFFDIFDVNLRSLYIKKIYYLFIEASWTTICALLNVFNLQIHEVSEKFDKNWKKLLNLGIFLFFLIFSMLIWGLFHIENNIHLFKVAIGQQICALFDGFNIVIHGVYQKFDKNCIKTIKLGNFLFFFVILGVNLRSFSFEKQHLSLHRSLIDN